MGKVKFERTWCDYLTPCSKFPEIEVGSYECFSCKHFVKFYSDEQVIPPGKYFMVVSGHVECKLAPAENTA